MHLGHEVYVNKIGIRRLKALVYGMPPDAVWRRKDAFPPLEELLVQSIERQHAWSEAMFQAMMRTGKRVAYPGPPTYLRPGQQEQKRKVETDPRVIARFFREHFGGESVM